jgi:hypothetical protein
LSQSYVPPLEIIVGSQAFQAVAKKSNQVTAEIAGRVPAPSIQRVLLARRTEKEAETRARFYLAFQVFLLQTATVTRRKVAGMDVTPVPLLCRLKSSSSSIN